MENNKEILSVDIISTGTNAYICSLVEKSTLVSRPSLSSGSGKKVERRHHTSCELTRNIQSGLETKKLVKCLAL